MKNAPLDVESMKKGHLEIELLGEHIATQAAHLDAATHRLLTDLRTFDEAGGWFRQGARSCATWLSWRVGWDGRTARDRVRVANRLGELPLVDDALRRGELSYSKVRAIARAATTPEIEATLMEYARHSTGAQLEKICRMYVAVASQDADTKPSDDLQRRSLRWRELEDGMIRFEGTFHPEEAALIKQAIERVAAEHCRERNTAVPAGSAEPVAERGSTSGSAEPLGTIGSGSVIRTTASRRSAAEPAMCTPSGSAEPVVAVGTSSGSVEPRGLIGSGSGRSDAETAMGTFSGSAEPVAVVGTPSGSAPLPDLDNRRELDPETGGRPETECDDELDECEESCIPSREAVSRGTNASARMAAVSDTRPRVDGRALARKQREAQIEKRFDLAGALVEIAQEVVRGTAKQRSPVSLVLTSTVETMIGSSNSIPSAHVGDLRNVVAASAAGDSMIAGVLPDGLCVSAVATRRLACDCAVTRVLEDERGNPLSIGRKTRTIPGAMKAAILRLDQTCKFPGCNARAFLEGHHLVHWAEGGETAVRNIMCLCSWHHRFVHEYGFEISMNADRAVTVIDPLGRKITDVPVRHVGPEVGVPMIHAANANLQISADTPFCGWNGEPIDYPACVDGLLAAERR